MKRSTRVADEFLGTAFLLLIVVGSGIMAESLSQGNAALALLANPLATGAGLFVLIQNLGPVSGAHFNPVVSGLEVLWKRLPKRDLVPFNLKPYSSEGQLTLHNISYQTLLSYWSVLVLE